MKVLRFIIGLPLAVLICVPWITFVIIKIFITSVYASIKYKESFKVIWLELYGAFVEGIKIGWAENKN